MWRHHFCCALWHFSSVLSPRSVWTGWKKTKFPSLQLKSQTVVFNAHSLPPALPIKTSDQQLTFCMAAPPTLLTALLRLSPSLLFIPRLSIHPLVPFLAAVAFQWEPAAAAAATAFGGSGAFFLSQKGVLRVKRGHGNGKVIAGALLQGHFSTPHSQPHHPYTHTHTHTPSNARSLLLFTQLPSSTSPTPSVFPPPALPFLPPLSEVKTAEG